MLNLEKNKIFDVQFFSLDTENKVLLNNLIIDYSFGHRNIVNRFLKNYPIFQNKFDDFLSLNETEKKKRIITAKSNSLLMTVIMLTGKCNANCSVCYTDRKTKKNELNFIEIKSLIDQSYELGSRLIYLPGEGEPTLDKYFWQTIEYASKKGMSIVLFTNGLTLSNKDESINNYGFDNIEAINKLIKNNVYIYFKLWSFIPKLVGEMMSINADRYNYTFYNGYYIPFGLKYLLENYSNKKIGIETIIEKRNLSEIVNKIIPFIEKNNIKSYIEPLIHSGRCINYLYEPEISDIEKSVLNNYVQRKECKRISYLVNIHNNGYLSSCMALSPEQISKDADKNLLNIRNDDNNIKSIYNLMHSNPDLAYGRYKIDKCFCEKLNKGKISNIYEIECGN